MSFAQNSQTQTKNYTNMFVLQGSESAKTSIVSPHAITFVGVVALNGLIRLASRWGMAQ